MNTALFPGSRQEPSAGLTRLEDSVSAARIAQLLFNSDPEGDVLLDQVLSDPHKALVRAQLLVSNVLIHECGRLEELLDKILGAGLSNWTIGQRALETVAMRWIMSNGDWETLETVKQRLGAFNLEGQGPAIIVGYWKNEVWPAVDPLAAGEWMAEALIRLEMTQDQGQTLLAWMCQQYDATRGHSANTPIHALINAGAPYSTVLSSIIPEDAKQAIRQSERWRREALVELASAAPPRQS